VEGSCEHGSEPSGSIKCSEVRYRYINTHVINSAPFRARRNRPIISRSASVPAVHMLSGSI
jgi:hypothetical protein